MVVWLVGVGGLVLFGCFRLGGFGYSFADLVDWWLELPSCV